MKSKYLNTQADDVFSHILSSENKYKKINDSITHSCIVAKDSNFTEAGQQFSHGWLMRNSGLWDCIQSQIWTADLRHTQKYLPSLNLWGYLCKTASEEMLSYYHYLIPYAWIKNRNLNFNTYVSAGTKAEV